MALNEDSKPFVVFRENAKNFMDQYNKDVKTLCSTFSSKISDLLCDPDTLNPGHAKKLSAHVEFSMAKREIFINMKDLIHSVSGGWEERIDKMMSSFLENIEIFLAGTKLSVTLPTPAEISKIEKKRSPEGLKGRKGSAQSSPASSLYPSLKSIPFFNAFVPESEDIDDEVSVIPDTPETPSRQNKRSPKQVTILTPEEMLARNSFLKKTDESGPSPHTPARKGRGSTSTTPLSLTKMPVKSSLRKTAITNSLKDSSEISNSPGHSLFRRKTAVINDSDSTDTSSEDPSARTPTPRKRRNVKEATPNNVSKDKSDEESTSRRSISISSQLKSDLEFLLEPEPSPVKTPVRKGRYRQKAEKTLPDSVGDAKEVFSVGMDINDDLDVYTPDVSITRSAPRRKTTVFQVDDDFADVTLTPTTTRARGKRKTIAVSALDEPVAPSPKRLKRGGGRNSLAPPTVAETSANLLDSDGSQDAYDYSPWMSLTDVSARVPAQPGVYELKVSAAKKPAYIGSCDSLRQMLTLHKLKNTTGHKHLDKFVERNLTNTLVRYETLTSAQEANDLAKERVRAFSTQFKTVPAYN